VTSVVTLDEIRAARERIKGVAKVTPLLDVSSVAGRPLWLKCESLQPGGAFKIRGAYNMVAQLTDEERRRGVITYSSGNHGQAVAIAARALGAPAVVVMPTTAPKIKSEGAKGFGAEIVFEGTTSLHRRAKAEEIAAARGLTMVPPFDHAWIIAGQGTLGLEIAEDVPDLAAVLIPIGGGGLSSGVAVAVRALHPTARILGVEPEVAADARDSLREGRIVRWSAEDVTRTMADGVRGQAIGRRPFAHLSRLMDDVVTVSEAEIAVSVRLIAEEARLVVEPSGAVAPAAARFEATQAGIADLRGTVVAVVSGGNVDPERYRRLLESPGPGT
jgi:threonine dehydratase